MNCVENVVGIDVFDWFTFQALDKEYLFKLAVLVLSNNF